MLAVEGRLWRKNLSRPVRDPSCRGLRPIQILNSMVILFLPLLHRLASPLAFTLSIGKKTHNVRHWYIPQKKQKTRQVKKREGKNLQQRCGTRWDALLLCNNLASGYPEGVKMLKRKTHAALLSEPTLWLPLAILFATSLSGVVCRTTTYIPGFIP